MIFFVVLLSVIVLIAIVIATCTKASSDYSKQEDYLEECARHRLNQRQEEDNDLD